MITIDEQKSRLYLRGDTYALRSKIKEAGGHWDPDQRAWWLGTAKRAVAEQLAGAAPDGGSCDRDEVTDDTKIVGKASYKGTSGYLILWMGQTRRGEAAKLAFRDGRVFWADMGEVTIEKTYQDREWHGRIEPGMTFGRLKRLREEYSQAKRDGIEPCGKCGGIHRDGGCYMCGCTRCEGAHGGLCEDD
jgi:hypothetical protein